MAAESLSVADANELIHRSLRLKVMAALNAARRDGPLEFTRLRALVGASDGNLSTHLSTLEAAGYVAIETAFVGKRPRTCITMTGEGATAFRGHVAYLRGLLAE